MDDLRDALAPLQVGVAVPSACELIVHTVREWYAQARPGELDFRNAFNSLDREVMLQEVAARLPALHPWASWCYNLPSCLFATDGVLQSSQGVQQGDPIGPALFALGTQSLWEEVRGDVAWESAYLDDGNMINNEAGLTAALEKLSPPVAARGVVLNPQKCAIWGDVRTLTSGILKQCRQVPLNEGIVVLGSYVGPSDFVEFDQKLTKGLSSYLEKLSQLDCPQAALILLQKCLGACRVVYAARTIPPALMGSVLEQVTCFARSALQMILECQEPLTDQQWLQACLPLSNGGLGITHPSDMGPPAFLASALHFRQNVHLIGQLVTSEELPVGLADAFRATSNLLEASSVHLQACLAAESLDPLSEDTLERFSSQHFWGQLVAERRVQRFDSMSTARERFRRQCQGQRHAASWLSAPPSPQLGTLFPKLSFRLLLRRWLGIALLPRDPLPRCPGCGATCDVLGDHFLSCANLDRCGRHNALRDAVHRVAEAAGFRCRVEVPVANLRPADLWVEGFSRGEDRAVDLSVTNPLQLAGNLQASSLGVAARQRASI